MGLSYVERNKEDLLSRLKKIEGQIRGIQKMIEEDRYCVDILLQISATRAALQKVALSLLRSHTRGCVARAIRQNRGDEAIDELMQVLDQFTR
ncbi:DNA-binding FrmR family transcriptional regulator [Desulfofundulus luciae]|uniref:DNA-binding FrmR family transcriptional regulator n=1 Tax=Desulfofundulus luciae TaxID=74702 RepID=A0ABU0B2H8_9FIRM|nr:metal-sensitive transcriptional regulator [Desulfofundulus luciae]MDQ0286479.1 DNA-binding FrmR family transcriptional regulator [Desulfofundulus luciae]